MLSKVILCLWIVFLYSSVSFAEIDPDLLAGMKARSIGPAGMSGRIAAIDAVGSNPDIIYVGAATGGVWKSENAGTTWTPVFDDQPVAAVGAVSVFQPNPGIVWVGTGEGNVRNSASVGNGVYKSLDGGKTWMNMGLDKTERIHRIVLHPTNPEIAYVAAMGQEWGENSDRGVFKTEDGGKTWKKVLYVNEKTGCADLVMDPSNPNKLFAAMWEYRRWPWFFRSGGFGSGLYVTLNGGENWEKLTEEDGLPGGPLGRIGIAIAASDPRIIYALVEAKSSVLIRSDDGGRKWTAVNTEGNIAGRPFYYADLRVDPAMPNRVYRLETLIHVSQDGGKTFEVLVPFREIHPDHHAMWIHPEDPTHIIIGNDGGIAVSHDRGTTWRFVANLPVAQFYHIRADGDQPYHVYGGLQDNGSWRGPAEVWENGGIRNHHWEEVGFGDGFDTVPDPTDSMMGYAMSQEGYLIRWNLRTGERKDIRPPEPEGIKLRFNWNAAIAIDPFDAATIYFGSQFVHKSTDRGETWTIISADLTTNNPEWQKQDESGGLTLDVTGAENHTTIIAIAPSPVEPNILWIGTDDGRIHVTRDGGKSWSSVERNVKGVPPNTWVPHIEPSKYDAASAFVVLDDHRRSNWTPYVYETNDFGNTWKSLATKDLWGYTLSLTQDPVKKDLLFLGTEFGLYFTIDGGKRWMKWKQGFPTVSAMDLMIHPREHDLIIGTHGRAVYVLDDVSPLRTLSDEILAEAIHVFDVNDSHQYRVKQTGASRFPGHDEFRGENEPYGAIITYSLNIEGLPYPDEKKEKERKEAERKKKFAAASLEEMIRQMEIEPAKKNAKEEEKRPQAEIRIMDPEGNLIRTMKGPANLGLNRAIWDLKRDAFHEPPRPPEQTFEVPTGPDVLPGTYTVVVRYQGHSAEAKVRVSGDPRYTMTEDSRKANWDALLRVGKLQESVSDAIERILSTRVDIDAVLQKADVWDRVAGTKNPEESPYKSLRESAKTLKEELAGVELKLWVPPRTQGLTRRRDALSKIKYAYRSISSTWEAPTPAQLPYLAEAEMAAQQALEEYNRLFAEKVSAFRKQVEEAGLLMFVVR